RQGIQREGAAPRPLSGQRQGGARHHRAVAGRPPGEVHHQGQRRRGDAPRRLRRDHPRHVRRRRRRRRRREAPDGRRVRGDDAPRQVPVEVRIGGRPGEDDERDQLMSTIGHFALFLALVCSAWAATASWLSTVSQGRGLQRSAERGVLCAFGLVALAVFALEYGFVTNDFSLDSVYHYSSVNQPLPYKIGALWGGQAGSLLLWALILSTMSSIVVVTNRNKNRAMMPWAVHVLAIVMTFFLVLTNFIASPFETGPLRADGVGLNPQLKNYWMMIHTPTLYLGYVGFTIPFAFGIAALVTRRTGDIWFRTTRRWTLFSWFF